MTTPVKNYLLILASIALLVVIGGAVYEHTAVVPQWSAAPPASFSMFQGRYALNPGAFWPFVHPLAVLLLIAATAANWKTERRKFILWALGTYIAVLAITAAYILPELHSILSTPYSNITDPVLKVRGDRWELISLVRLGVMFVMAGVLLTGLTKPAARRAE